MVLQVSAAVLSVEDKVFAARRGLGRHLAGYWEFPGGKIEAHETPEQCLVRELSEELGITAKIGSFIMQTEHSYEDQIVNLHAYWVTDYIGEIDLKDHDDMKWLTVDQLASVQWAPADVPIVEEIRRLSV